MRGKLSALPVSARATALALAALLFSASSVSAATLTDERPFLSSFDGSDTTAGQFTGNGVNAVATDYASGDVYVIDGGNESVDRFNAAGEAQDFPAGSAAGTSSLLGPSPGVNFSDVESSNFFNFFPDIAVDNSGGLGGPGEGEQGRLYVSGLSGPVHAFDPEGNYLWTLPRKLGEALLTESACGLAVGPEGHLWVGVGARVPQGREKVLEFNISGSEAPGAPIDEFKVTSGNKTPCRLAVDNGGTNVYVAHSWVDSGGLGGLAKYSGGFFASTLTPEKTQAVALDQTIPTGHIFALHESSFREFDSSGAPVKTFGGDLIANSRGIAYNPTLDRTYVSDLASKAVKVFGPLASGTVPDVSTEASTEIALHAATAHGTINPQSVPNAYHFEWKEGTGSNWGTAESSAEQSIEPTDSDPHAVSLGLSGLKSNATYQVRLVGTNTENDLRSYAAPDTFSTLLPPPPSVSIDAIAPIDTDSAHIEATIDPIAEETSWKVEKSTDPTCASGFSAEPTQTIPEGESGSVAVEWDLEGLLPAQHYCVRITATGPGGNGSDTEKFSTDAIAPSDASTAFAAPRTDTTARINARVNPEGEADLSYRFELSEDGTNWTQLPIRVSSIGARKQILVAEELNRPRASHHLPLPSRPG